MTSSMDTEFYRLVPYRFFFNEQDTEMCKLEKLTNLFPDMKAIIELELFKTNNLTRMIDRLSNIYTVFNALDVRDDTLHIFLGPYHLSLGPAIFGAHRFKNVSMLLLAASTSNPHRRRHEAVLRRFRRGVRKLILVKSIIDQLGVASILTPYNQYELYTQGIYDLVLAGNTQDLNSMLSDNDFIEQINNIQSGEESPLLASNFVKINTLLHLLSPTPHQQQPDNNLTIDNTTQTKSNDISSNIANEKNPKSLIDSTALCCSQHAYNSPLIKLPINQPIGHHSISTGYRSRFNSSHNLRKNSSAHSRESIPNSLPELTTNDTSSTDDIPSSTAIVPSSSSNLTELDVDKAKKITELHPNTLSSGLTTNEEDVFINRISSLFINYISSHESTTKEAIASHANDNHERSSNINDREISSSPITTKITSNISDLLDQQSSLGVTNEFDKLLQRIKTVVDNRLTRKTLPNQMHPPEDLSPIRMRTTTHNRSQKIFATRRLSHQETSIDESGEEHMTSSNTKHKLLLSSKSQSFDETNLMLSSIQAEPNDDCAKFSSIN